MHKDLRRLLECLRVGSLTDDEVADFAAEAGTQQFFEAKNDLLGLLDHADGVVRFNAIATMAYEWGDKDVLERVLVMLRSDPDRDCRRQAAGAVGAVSRGCASSRVMEVLASAIRDPSEHEDVRAFAFTALLDVVGVPRAQQPNPLNLIVGDQHLKWLDTLLKNNRQTH